MNVQLKRKKKGSEAESQVIRLGWSQSPKKQQPERFWIESLTASTAEPGTVQLCAGEVSAITNTLHHYGGGLPFLRKPAITERVHNYRGEPPLLRQF